MPQDWTFEQDIDVDVLTKGPKGRTSPISICDEDGIRVFKLKKGGASYEVVVEDTSDYNRYVAQVFVGGRRTLVGKHSYLPVSPMCRTLFPGFEAQYSNTNFEATVKYNTLDITRDSQHDGRTEEITIHIFKNDGHMTYNRGGCHDFQSRGAPCKRDSITVSGDIEEDNCKCPPAKKRWESRKGEYFGEICDRVEREPYFYEYGDDCWRFGGHGV